jgi:hypothetical protein
MYRMTLNRWNNPQLGNPFRIPYMPAPRGPLAYDRVGIVFDVRRQSIELGLSDGVQIIGYSWLSIQAS